MSNVFVIKDYIKYVVSFGRDSCRSLGCMKRKILVGFVFEVFGDRETS